MTSSSNQLTAAPPTVSILINNYNYGRFLRDAIDSALGQTHPVLELIIVDDGSTDDSRSIIAAYADRARVVLKPNGGQASAFNAGLALARGDVVLFLDSDDYLLPRAVERILAHWHPVISRCHFRLHKVNQAREVIGQEPPPAVPLSAGHLQERQLARRGCTWVPTSGNAFRREVLQAIFPVDERFRICADGWIFYRSAFHGEVLAIEEVLGAYRIHGANNYGAANYDLVATDAQTLRLLNCKVSAAHSKISAARQLPGHENWSVPRLAGKHLSLTALRELLLAKHLGIAGPVPDLDRQLTWAALRRLVLAACFRRGELFRTRFRSVVDLVSMPWMTRAQAVHWVREGFGSFNSFFRQKS